MDYKTEQETEVELIHSVYPDETEIISREYPQMQLKVTLPSEPRFENPEPDFFVDLLLSLPAKYPEDAPAFELSGFPEDFPKKLIHELEEKLSDQAKSMPGYQVLITLITELQYQLPLMLKKVQDDRDAEEQRIRDEKEEAERKRFEGNRVTVESFNKWRVEFEREFLAAELEAKKAREALIGNKLTGKQLFLRDHSLNMWIAAEMSDHFRNGSHELGLVKAPLTYAEFREFVADKHSLHAVPFTLCYTSTVGDLLPITNDEGESWEEKYGYGTGTLDRKKRGFGLWMPASNKPQRRNYNISNPEDFRQVSAIIDVDIVPETHRRVRLCKHGSDRPLGFYIRPGTRLVAGGLAESTGLISKDDEIIEVNGIDVQGKTVDQVTDMMVANARNLVVTIKPANQQNGIQKAGSSRQTVDEPLHYANLLNRAYRSRPLASKVLEEYIRGRGHPSWTSFFLPYKHVQDDLFGEKHVNFDVDGRNYHVLRIGCFPEDLSFENRLYKAITVCNLGIPCLLYGLAAIFLIKHTDWLELDGRRIPVHFLIKEDHD
ncbi:hypothetical protein M3Y99_00371000 [Aphelenchoides fujianensis]|nr:hypothetical protein M3Y99_00371000 [Aphelenchoides fujianensis]